MNLVATCLHEFSLSLLFQNNSVIKSDKGQTMTNTVKLAWSVSVSEAREKNICKGNVQLHYPESNQYLSFS